MKYTLRTLSPGLLIFLLCTASSSQSQLDKGPSDPWLVRAQSLTDELMADAVALDTVDRALLWARLGDIWWRDDQARARAWMQKAVEVVEFSSDQESPALRRRRVSAVRALLSIIVPRDRTLSARLTRILTPDSNQTSNDERSGNAEALVNAALAVLESDPEQAAQLGSASLRTGRTNLLIFLLYRLRSRDSKLADTLFNQTLAAAQSDYDEQLLFVLTSVAFPAILDPYVKAPLPPDELRAALLGVLANGLQRSLTSSGDSTVGCGLAQTAAPLLVHFSRLLPQEVGIVQSAISKCRAQLDERSRQRVDDNTREQPLKSVDDLLKAAKEAKSPDARSSYLARAIQMAAHEKEYERAIAILDGMSDEDREQFGKAWKGWRWEFASSAAYAHFKHQNNSMMQKVIEDTPADLRPLAQISLANQVAIAGDREVAFRFFEEARQGLAKADLSNSAKAGRYLEIARQYVKLQPTEAVKVLREAVKSLNRIEPLNGGDATDTSRGDARPGLEPIEMTASFLEIDDLGTTQALSDIEAPLMRSQIRMGLLKASLERGKEVKRAGRDKSTPPLRKPNVDH
jgi:hypothetical protein